MLQSIVGFVAIALGLYASYTLYQESIAYLERSGEQGGQSAEFSQIRFPRFERAVSLGCIGFVFTYVIVYIIVALIWDMRWAFTAFKAPFQFFSL